MALENGEKDITIYSIMSHVEKSLIIFSTHANFEMWRMNVKKNIHFSQFQSAESHYQKALRVLCRKYIIKKSILNTHTNK